MTRRRLHWFWRAVIATVVACFFSGLAWDVTETAYRAVKAWVNSRIPFVNEDDFVLAPLLISLPAILLAFIVYGLLTRFTGARVEADGETHCRNCGYILRGLSEPTCSECGERI